MTNSADSVVRLVVWPFPAWARALAFEVAVDALGRAGEPDESDAFDRHLALDGLLGLADLFVDAAQGARAVSPGHLVCTLCTSPT